MFIIKDGDKKLAEKKKNKAKLFECKICGCVFVAYQEEYIHSGVQWDDYYYSKCPCCGDDAEGTKGKQL